MSQIAWLPLHHHAEGKGLTSIRGKSEKNTPGAKITQLYLFLLSWWNIHYDMKKKHKNCCLSVAGRKEEKHHLKEEKQRQEREWIIKGVTGRLAGAAESCCDSTEEEWKTDLGFICISNLADFLVAVTEGLHFALHLSSLSFLPIYVLIYLKLH